MMLIDHYLQIITRLILTQTEDGEGGSPGTYKEGDTFFGALVRDETEPAQMGDSNRLYNHYTLTVSRDTELGFRDVVRDASGTTYRIISDGVQTPKGFTALDMRQYKAERWDIE